ncbi:hypothetical protein ES707_04986 [subsurface metagenome]
MNSKRKSSWINGPDLKTQEILKAALNHVQSVSYKVSLRWVFYRLYQDGYYKTKEGYNRFEYLCSRARHTGWNGWKPDSLADETREIIRRIYGYPDIEEALEEMPGDLASNVDLSIDHFYRQDNYIEIWYEARAMTGQFRHYTAKIDLVPLGGMSSIPYKWSLAKGLEWKRKKYQKPIKILYFGDEDLAGHNIKADVEEDVRKWSEAAFEIVWCGLTKEQAEKYGIPHSIEKQGFQWEALDDEAASEIIRESLDRFIDRSIIKEAEKEANEQEEHWSDIVREAINDIIKMR